MSHPGSHRHLTRLTLALAGLAVLAMLLACGGRGGRAKRNKPRGTMEDKPAPALAGKDLDGKDVALSQYLGKVVVLDIWTTWCPHCIEAIPNYRKLVKRLEGKPFVLVSVSDDDDRETVVNFLKKKPLPWVNWWNGEGGVSLDGWTYDGYPTVYVIDHKGVVRHADLDPDELDQAVDSLLAEMGR